MSWDGDNSVTRRQRHSHVFGSGVHLQVMFNKTDDALEVVAGASRVEAHEVSRRLLKHSIQTQESSKPF